MYGQADGSIIIDTELDSQGFEAGSKELESAISSFGKTISKIGQSLNSLGPTFTRALQGSGSAINSFDSKIGKIDESLQKARDEIVNMENQLNSLGSAQIPTEEYTRLTNLIDSTGAKIDELVYKQRQLSQSDSNGVINRYLELKDQIASTEAQLEKLRALQSEMQSSSNDYSRADFERVGQAIAETEVNLETLNMQMRELESTGGASSKIAQYQSLQTQIEQLSATADEATQKMAAMEQDGSAYTVGAKTAKYQELEATLRNLKSEYEHNAAAADSMKSQLAGTNAQVSGTERSTRRLSNTTNTLRRNLSRVGSVGKAAFSAIGSRIKSAASSMLGLLTHTKSTKSQFSGLISSAKKFTLSLLGARGVYALLRKAVSAYMSENEELSNTLNSVWSGIGNLLGPIITRLINLVATAASYVTSFLKLFNWFGSSTSKSISKANDSAQELKRTLASFDDLNILSEKSSSSNSDDSNSASTLPDVTLPDWAKMLVDQIKSGDWGAAAKTLAKQLTNMVESVDWAGLGTKIGKLFNGALTFLATFIDTFDWIGLGSKLATFFNNLIKNVNWSNLGKLLVAKWTILLKLLVGFFENFDGKAFGKALHQVFTGIITAVDWVSLSGRLGKAISKVITDINWKQLGTDVGTLFRTALQSISAFVSSVNWKSIGESVADFINGIDWNGIFNDLGELIGNLFVGALDLLSGFVSRVDWEKLAKDIGDWFKALPEKIEWDTFGEKLGKFLNDAIQGVLTFAVTLQDYNWEEITDGLINGIIDTFTNAIKNISWEKVIGLWVTAITQFLLRTVTAPFRIGGYIFGTISKLIGKFFEAIGLDGIAGFFKGIGDALTNVGTWIKENIIDPVVGWVKKLFGISSPSKVFAEIGGFLIQGLFAGIKAAWNFLISGLTTLLSGLASLVSKAWAGIKSAAKWAWDGITGVVSSAWNGIKSGLSNAWNGIKTGASNVWNGIKNTASSAWEGIKGAASSAWNWITGNTQTKGDLLNKVNKKIYDTIKNDTSGKFDELKATLGKKYDESNSVWTKLSNSIKSKLNDTGEKIKSSTSKVFSNVASTISTKWNEVKSNTSSVWDNLKNTLSGKWDSIKNSASTKFDSLKSTIQNKGWTGIGSNIISGIQNGINNGWSWLSSTVSSLASGMLSTAKSALGIHSPSKIFRDEVGLNIGYGIGEGIDDSESYVLKSITGIADSIADEAAVEIPPIQYAESSVVSGLDHVADKLSNIAAIFQSITDMLSSMGGLKIPQIATGTVVPYANRVEGVLSPTGLAGAFPADFADGVDEQLYDITDLLRQLIEIVRALNLNIDLKALADMLTRLQREKARNFGGAL